MGDKMELSDYERTKLQEFLEATSFMLQGYHDLTFCYLAFQRAESFELQQGRLMLNTEPQAIVSEHFSSKSVKAGVYRISELNLDLHGFINALLKGEIQTPNGTLRFPSESDRCYSISYDAFHDAHVQPDRRLKRLSVQGARRGGYRERSVEWELKASPTPFDNIQDLCLHYNVGAPNDSALTVEVIALNLVAVAPSSTVTGGKATLAIDLAKGLEPKKTAIGYRLFQGGKVITRGMISGSQMNWTQLPATQRGETQLDVTPGAVFHCIASYNGEAQHQHWVSDSSTVPNPLRTAYQALDEGLETLQDYLSRTPAKGEARDLESGVARLLWMHGFAVLHLDGDASDGPDLIARTPAGNIVIIECTTGILKQEKFTLLLERTRKVRESLKDSGNSHLRVLPIMVTSKTRQDVEANLEQARKLGVHIMSGDDLRLLLERSLVLPNADEVFNNAEAELERMPNTDYYGLLSSRLTPG